MILPDILPLERPLIGLDLETTGRNAKASAIVEIGLEIMKPGEPVKEWRTLVNPMRPIPPGATKVHHITDEMVRGCQVCGLGAGDTDAHAHLGDTPHDFKPWPTFPQLAANLARGFAGCDFVGYNVRFDLKQLAEEFSRTQSAWDYESAYIVDGLRLWQCIDPRSLEDFIRVWVQGQRGPLPSPADCTTYEFEGQAHNALWDIKNTTRGIAHLLHACPTLPRTTRGIHDLIWAEWFDAEGKLKWNDGGLCLSFGEHRDKPLRRAPRSYLEWIIKKDFSSKVKDTCRNALRGVLPPAPIMKETPDEDVDSSPSAGD